MENFLEKHKKNGVLKTLIGRLASADCVDRDAIICLKGGITFRTDCIIPTGLGDYLHAQNPREVRLPGGTYIEVMETLEFRCNQILFVSSYLLDDEGNNGADEVEETYGL